MTELARESVLCPQDINKLVMKPGGLVDTANAAPGHEKYVEIQIDRCAIGERGCDPDATDFLREMGKIYLELAIVGDYLDLRKFNDRPLRTTI